MDRTRIKLAVYVDLDPTPGEFHSADSARNAIGNILQHRIPHYNPMVSIESYDTSKDAPKGGVGETATNLDTYVDGFKVVSSTTTTATLENGVEIAKAKCRLVSVDAIAGATYYRYDED